MTNTRIYDTAKITESVFMCKINGTYVSYSFNEIFICSIQVKFQWLEYLWLAYRGYFEISIESQENSSDSSRN